MQTDGKLVPSGRKWAVSMLGFVSIRDNVNHSLAEIKPGPELSVRACISEHAPHSHTVQTAIKTAQKICWPTNDKKIILNIQHFQLFGSQKVQLCKKIRVFHFWS